MRRSPASTASPNSLRSFCTAPYALMALVDANRQWFKARYGLELDQAPRRIAFGNQVIHNSRPFVVADANRIRGSAAIRW